MAPDQVVSTGRGGKGNIGHDTNVYVDGAIVRQGNLDESANPNLDLSTGRGGRGNIGRGSSPENRENSRGRDGQRTDEEYVPETAARNASQDKFHTGRGGQGNIYKEKYGGHSTAKEAAAAAAEKERAAMKSQDKERKSGIGEKVMGLFKKEPPN